MLTLTKASLETKQILKWGGLFLGSVFMILVLIRIAIIVRDIVAPPPPPPPTEAFGKLPPQAFPQNATDMNLSYSINTVTGSLPANFPTQAKVYRIQLNQPDLLGADKFDKKAQSIGFGMGYTAISDKIFEWKSSTYNIGIPKVLDANITNGDFTISSAYLTDQNIINANNLPDQAHAIAMAQKMLSSMNILSDDLDMNKTKTNLWSITNGALSPASSLSVAQIVEVDFVQKDVDKLPIFYDNPNSSNMSILISGGQAPQIVAANFVHQAISDQFATYPLKPVSQAYDILTQGGGYIASYTGNSPSVQITDVVLGYYMSSQPQDFLMPVYIFEGTGNFYAYVPALTDVSINK